MKNALRKMLVIATAGVPVLAMCALAQDWPQWRGVNRDAKVTGFTAPTEWPKTLNKKWSLAVGEGADSTPALVGNKLYVFTKKDGQEVLMCLDADTSKELWSDKYPVANVSGPDSGHPGPRSTPAVANGKVCTLGVMGVLSCYDAEKGKLLWRKDDFPGAFPRFHTAMSPVIVDNLCIGHFGNAENGAIAAYDLATGDIKWKWSGGAGFGPSYSSPVVATLGGVKQVIVQTEKNVVSVSVADGKLLWQEKSAGGRYAASSPVVDEANSVMFGTRGNGSYAIKISKDGDTFKTEQLWNNTTVGAEYVTPVLKNDFLYGINPQNTYYCLNAKTGETAWPAPAAGGATPAAPAGGPGRRGGMGGGMGAAGGNVMGAVAGGGMGGGMGAAGGNVMGAVAGGGMGGGRGMGGGMGRGMGMGGGGYGSVVDAGSVLFGLTSNGKLVVYEPSDKEYKELATYQVGGQMYAYPIISGKRIFTADQTTVTLWTIE